MHQREREVEPALHPARVRLDLPFGGGFEADTLQQLVRPALALVPGYAVERRLQTQVLAAR